MGSEWSTGIIIVILVIIVIFAVRSSLKHFKGEGGCCGGGSERPKVKKQKLHQVVGVKRMEIEGMKCENCRRNVENELNALSQVNAKVHLKEKEAVVKLGVDVPDDRLKEIVEKLGYQVVSIRHEK